jgi:hypothetical protein
MTGLKGTRILQWPRANQDRDAAGWFVIKTAHKPIVKQGYNCIASLDSERLFDYYETPAAGRLINQSSLRD